MIGRMIDGGFHRHERSKCELYGIRRGEDGILSRICRLRVTGVGVGG